MSLRCSPERVISERAERAKEFILGGGGIPDVGSTQRPLLSLVLWRRATTSSVDSAVVSVEIELDDVDDTRPDPLPAVSHPHLRVIEGGGGNADWGRTSDVSSISEPMPLPIHELAALAHLPVDGDDALWFEVGSDDVPHEDTIPEPLISVSGNEQAPSPRSTRPRHQPRRVEHVLKSGDTD